VMVSYWTRGRDLAAQSESINRQLERLTIAYGQDMNPDVVGPVTIQRADQIDGTRLDSAAHRLTLPLVRAPKLIEGERLTLGASRVPDVSVWAFEARPGETSPVIDAARASYVFRLDSLEAAGVPPLASIRARVLGAARYEKKKTVARQQAEQAAAALRDAADLLAAGRARGNRVEKLGPFTRVTAPAQFARDPLLLGAAFGLRRGERSGVIADETGWFVLQALAHAGADSAAWLKQRDQQRESLVRPIEQARLQQFVQALRADAKIVDRRSELFRPGIESKRCLSALPCRLAPARGGQLRIQRLVR